LIRSDKKVKELAINLAKDNSLLVAEAIKALRSEEPFEGAVPLLVALFERTDNRLIHKTIEEFFNDIKDKSVRPEIITEIRKPWKANTISMLVASCWQSGLDYSEYLNDMAIIFLEGDYTTSIECMTVMEESAPYCSRNTKDSVIRSIEESYLSGMNEKYSLTLELISILKR
jgi:predicted DNA-binding protein